MCGIAGFIQTSAQSQADQNNIAQLMANSLASRGPDAQTTWREDGVNLAHSRLSILDLTPEGAQPMRSLCERYVLTYNGEIYNYLALAAELKAEGHQFKGHCDTEVLLAGIQHWGLEATLPKLNGMFAFAVYDRHEKKIHLVRDPFGKKPVYFSCLSGLFLFGSELKALQSHPDYHPALSRDALSDYLHFNYVPAPSCIYENTHKLMPGECLTVCCKTLNIRQYQYHSQENLLNQTPFSGSFGEAVDELEALLKEAITCRLHSDVPLGAFLSGGIDSSTVVALQQRISSATVKTFTIGFSEQDYNEAVYAKKIANYLGTDHTELMVTPEMAQAVIPKLPNIYDEPFSDASQIPTVLVSQLARTQVTVALSGDGGDELFGGYHRYFWAPTIWQRIKFMPLPVRKLISRAILGIPQGVGNVLLAPAQLNIHKPLEKLQKIAGFMSASEPFEVYRRLLATWSDPPIQHCDHKDYLSQLKQQAVRVDSFTEAMMYVDLCGYLPDNILVKMDRASMANSLEARCPLLDKRVIEFAYRLPLDMKMKNHQGKLVLRSLLQRFLPEALFIRPKMGFAVPIEYWLRGPLKAWCTDLLASNKLKHEGYFDVGLVEKKVKEHMSGKRNWQYQLWNLCMFEAWLNR